MTKRATVHIEDICFTYETDMVLKHINMDITPNRVCFVMGNNGSGKTTLLKNLMGFLVPQTGKIKINNADISSFDRKALSRLVSYVPQAIHLNTDFSVIDYISLGRTPYMGFSNKLQKTDYDIIEKYAVELGVNGIYSVQFNNLSGGQKQMVAITRSLVQETPLIILDEPMSALDIGKQVDLLKLIGKLAQKGRTVIMTSHNPNHALALESDSCFLQNGEIVAYGRSEEIIQETMLKRIYGENITINSSGMRSVVFDMGKTRDNSATMID